jgi:hypothetical protein
MAWQEKKAILNWYGNPIPRLLSRSDGTPSRLQTSQDFAGERAGEPARAFIQVFSNPSRRADPRARISLVFNQFRPEPGRVLRVC